MNSWANIGDLVFVLGRDNNEFIPCKVINELGSGKDVQLFFEPIEDNDKKKVPKARLKAFLNQVGFNGGFVFKEKQNGLDYLEAVKTGNFNMGTIISKKARRTQQRIAQESGKPYLDIEKIKEEATIEAVNRVHKSVIAAMLLALNSELHIGPKRGVKVVEEINRLLEEVGEGNMTQEELVDKARAKMKIDL